MDNSIKQVKKNFLVKTWERCRSLPGGGREKDKPISGLSKSKSWHAKVDQKRREKTHQFIAPGGCFSVYVGPEKQRFAVKTKHANHPLFVMLLEDAEMEYGYNSDGPILLPCEVDLFYKVLAEMESSGKEREEEQVHGCGFVNGACSPFNDPSRRLGNSEIMGKGYGSYGLLTPSNLIRMN